MSAARLLDRVAAPLDRRRGEGLGAWRHHLRAGPAVGGSLLLLVGLVLGVLVVANRTLAVMSALAVLLVGAAAIDLALVCVVAVPASLVMIRVGGFLSVADVVLAGAAVIAIVLMSAREARPMQPLIWLAVGYLASLVPTLMLNIYAANLIEWGHEAVLVIGSLMVGWVIGRQDKARAALNIFVVVCVVMAVSAVGVGLVQLATQGAFGPVYLPYLHKNLIGDCLASLLVIAYAKPVWLGWGQRTVWIIMICCAAGMAAAQSRQAILSAIVGVAVVNLRPRIQTGRRSRLIWFVAIPVAIFVVNAVNAQLQSSNQFNSANQRIMWFRQSVEIWQHSPIFGVGLRWWYTARFDASFQPPNAEFEMITSGGIAGLAGFLVLFLGATWVLAKMDPVYGTVALATVLTRFTQGQFDLYWVAGQASFLWIVVGIAFGVQARDLRLGRRYSPVDLSRGSPRSSARHLRPSLRHWSPAQ